jgi:hypothetical protein
MSVGLVGPTGPTITRVGLVGPTGPTRPVTCPNNFSVQPSCRASGLLVHT